VGARHEVVFLAPDNQRRQSNAVQAVPERAVVCVEVGGFEADDERKVFQQIRLLCLPPRLSFHRRKMDRPACSERRSNYPGAPAAGLTATHAVK